MSDETPKHVFLAVLIYDDGAGRFSEEPHTYLTTHPEIAYQLALADGSEQRYGRRFLGLSHLEVTKEEETPIARSAAGDANEKIVEKDVLAAFSDPRWKDVECGPNEIAEALSEPPLVCELDGLTSLPWHTVTHAHGPATDVPRDIRRLASTNNEIREQALWQLFGSVYHQGTLYPATVPAIPFLAKLAGDSRIENRGGILELLKSISESATVAPERLRKTWAWRVENFGEIYRKPSAQMAEDQINTVQEVRRALIAHRDTFNQLAQDGAPEIAAIATTILKILSADDPITS